MFKKAAVTMMKSLVSVLNAASEIFQSIARNIEFIRPVNLRFTPRPDDVFITTYSRSGSTWMQMILYQLTTDGNMDIKHINQFSPWFERFLSRSLISLEELDGRPSPRIFKTHLSYKWAPKGKCKYIYVTRDGRDVAVSLYHFYMSHLGYQGTFEDFFRSRFLPGKVQYGTWFKHVSEWEKNRDGLDILYLRFEDMVGDLEGSVRKIIDFCGFEVGEERIPGILEKCGFEFMKKHEGKFDHLQGMLWERGHGAGSFIRKGKAGEGKLVFSAEQEELFKKEAGRWGVGG